MHSKHLLYIAIIPSDPPAIALHSLKKVLSEKTGLKRTLKSPPHITLVPPFFCEEAQLPTLVNETFRICSHTEAMHIETAGYDFFSNRVLFAKPAENEQLTHLHLLLRDALAALLPKRKERPYNAHLSLLLNDRGHPLPMEMLKDLVQNLPPWDAFTANAAYLLRHTNGRWNVFIRFDFGKK